MRLCWFPDNTVLCNFAAVDRMDVLRQTLDGRGRWTEAVAREAIRSVEALPPLKAFVSDGDLGEPIGLSENESKAVEHIRRVVFGGLQKAPLQHLGEAQTCYVIEHRPALEGSFWITDDSAAYTFARQRGITTLQTADVMSHAVVDGVVSAVEGFRPLKQMVAAGRVLHRCPQRPDDLRR